MVAVFFISYYGNGHHGGCSGKESTCQCKRCGFDPRVGKIPWRRKVTTRSNILAWEIPWTEVPGGLPSIRAGHDWVTSTHVAVGTMGDQWWLHLGLTLKGTPTWTRTRMLPQGGPMMTTSQPHSQGDSHPDVDTVAAPPNVCIAGEPGGESHEHHQRDQRGFREEVDCSSLAAR